MDIFVLILSREYSLLPNTVPLLTNILRSAQEAQEDISYHQTKHIWTIYKSFAASQIWDAAQTLLVALEIEFSVSRLEPALNWNRFLPVQRCGQNSCIAEECLFLLFRCYSGSFESTTAWEVKEDCLPKQRAYASMTRLGNVILMAGGFTTTE